MRRISWIVIFSWLATTLVAQSELDKIRELIRDGDIQQARQRLEPLLLTADGNQAELHYLMGVIALQLEDYAKAVSHLRIAAQADPNNAAILKLLVKAQLLSGERLEVEALLQKAARLSPDDAEVWSLLGRLYQESSRFKEAVQPLERAVELNPSDVSAWTSLAFTQFGLGELEKAVSSFGRAISENERSPKTTGWTTRLVCVRSLEVGPSDRSGRPDSQGRCDQSRRSHASGGATSAAGTSPCRLRTLDEIGGLCHHRDSRTSPRGQAWPSGWSTRRLLRNIRSKRCRAAWRCWTTIAMASWTSISPTARKVRRCARPVTALQEPSLQKQWRLDIQLMSRIVPEWQGPVIRWVPRPPTSTTTVTRTCSLRV